MSRVNRAVEKGETDGFMKVLVDAESRQVLGAAILGPGGDEAIHSLLDLMYAKAPYDVARHAVHIHPTVAELIPTMLGAMRLPSADPAPAGRLRPRQLRDQSDPRSERTP